MIDRATAVFLFLLFLPLGCSHPGPNHSVHLAKRDAGTYPKILAVYEAWWGHPRHISIGYSSHDPEQVQKQIREAKAMGISGFVVDWYGYREPFIDQSYALMQATAAKEHFQVAMMYDESDNEGDATEEAMQDFKLFHDNYLAPNAPGRSAYLTYEGKPVIFIFPKSGQTDWDRVRAYLNRWDPAPLLIYENLPGKYAGDFDGFYAWVNPGPKGWAVDGSNWGKEYLDNFYSTMQSKYPDKIAVGGAWSQFDDSKASWGLNRHISARCGQTFNDTLNLWRKYYPPDNPIPFMLVETWNDYEEGTDVEPGIPSCSADTHKVAAATLPKSRK